MSIPTGFVLRPPRLATSNARTTGEVTNGVDRHHQTLPSTSAYYSTGLVEVAADQYRASVLQGSGSEEYLIWAANTSSLAMLETQEWTVTASNPSGSVRIPVGVLDVGVHTDGTARLVVQDTGGRSLAEVRLLQIVRGDTGAIVQAGPASAEDFDSQDPDAGWVVLSAASLSSLGGGVSTERGDTITQVDYILASARFWWTRNDAQNTRFGWNGKTQRWEPFKGTVPQTLGALSTGGGYNLSPKPTRFQVGDFLPGDSLDPNQYAILRVGLRPDSSSNTPSVLVVSDKVAAGSLDWVGLGNPDAVMGVTSGALVFNPAYTTYVGLSVWYNAESYLSGNSGELGLLATAETEPLYLSPVPGPTDLPFIRLGSRRPLTALAVDLDGDLPNEALVPEGFVYWSRSTGKLALSQVDILKAHTGPPSSPNASFDVQYLGCRVYFDGVSLTTRALATPSPVQLTDVSGVPSVVGSTGKLYIPDATYGFSGVRLVPDGTGVVPNTSVQPNTRPNGSGLVRAVTGVGDTLLFTDAYLFDETEVVEFNSDLKALPFTMRKTLVQVAKERVVGEAGSAVQFKRSGLVGKKVYFLQAEVQPAVYVPDAHLYSRYGGPYTFVGGETLYFAVDGVLHSWVAPTGTMSAVQVAQSLLTASSPSLSVGEAFALRDRVVLASTTGGSVEIGFGPTLAVADRDFSGASILGFLPGWVADSFGSFQADNGTSLGVFRSPLNRDRSNTTPDFSSRGSFDGDLLSASLIASPYFTLNNPPLQDVAGYDHNVFFQVVDGLDVRSMHNFVDVHYEFEQGRISFLAEGVADNVRVEAPTQTLLLGHTGVLGDSLHPSVGQDYGLSLASSGGAYTQQEVYVDYLLPGGGSTGQAVPVTVVGGIVCSGSSGSGSSTTFLDIHATFLADGVAAGHLVQVLSGGVYEVVSVESETSITVHAPFPTAASNLTWQIRQGYTEDVYDDAVVADVQYTQFNYLNEEPFKIRLLSLLGLVGSTLQASVADSYSKGRVVGLRFGQTHDSPEATLTPLQVVGLGEAVSGALQVPSVLDAHFTESKFSIKVGDRTYTHDYPATGDGLLVGVAFLPPFVAGDVVEYDTATGTLLFGDALLADLGGSDAIYHEEFLSTLVAGQAEYNPATGAINLSALDLVSYTGEPCYFVEQMLTEGQEDVVVAPLSGSFFFQQPLRAGQIVEASYYPADNLGNLSGGLVTEFLPTHIRQEQATRVTDLEYTINPTGRTIAPIGEYVWVDAFLQNFGNATDVVLFGGTLTFANSITSTAVVAVSYGVFEAFGGEQAYNTSVSPVYRPPFFLDAQQTAFTLAGDRTLEMEAGKLLRLGAQPFYIKSSLFDGTNTTVNIWPPSALEAGSRSPGNDVLTLLSSRPVALSVDGVSTAGRTGFLLPLVGLDYEPVGPGRNQITFYGDVTRYMASGHLLEVGGFPFLVASSRLASDGRTTQVNLTSPTPQAFDGAVVRASARPIYPPSPQAFEGIYAFLPEEGVDLVVVPSNAPGRTLVAGVDYTAQPTDGRVDLNRPLGVGERLLFSYTLLRTLAPFVSNGAVVYPRYKAKYSYVSAPSVANGLLGTTLQAKYTFSSPDSFFYRTVPLQTYMGEVAQQAVRKVQAQMPMGGPLVVSGPAVNNYDMGVVGLLGQQADLEGQDRAARAFIQMYNDTIVSFEQSMETMQGGIVGDYDGKFRFFVGRDKPYTPPGYEDSITGRMNSRAVWVEVFLAASGSIRPTPLDVLVNPETASLSVQGEVVGSVMDPYTLDFYMQKQKSFLRNDMDDVVLTGSQRPLFQWGNTKMLGEYAPMWTAHKLSRLYPESTQAFTTTLPGMGDTGVYAFLKMINAPALSNGGALVLGSTFGRMIGAVANPAMGHITNISDIQTRSRMSRARVWAYSPTGFPEVDAIFSGDPTYTPTAGVATVLATVGPLKDFPVDASTGLPDFTRFLSEGGDLLDLVTGDTVLSNPSFVGTDFQIQFGRPTGESVSVGNAQQILRKLFQGINTTPTYGGVFVGAVQKGCILTLADDKGNALSGADVLAIGVDVLDGSPIAVGEGDTIYVIAPQSKDASNMSNPPTVEEMVQFAEARPTLDVGVRRQRGEWFDLSLPSLQDPSFPIKELTNQKTPGPLSTIEADVAFTNVSRNPFEFPALRGEYTNDAGDYGIPYLASGNTELDRLGQVTQAFEEIKGTDALGGAQAVYPDEILMQDGQVNTGSGDPATLYTAQDLLPVTTAGSYVAHSGVGDIRPFDVVLVEVPNGGMPVGSTGILSVGAVGHTTLEVPRFISASRDGDVIKYTLHNAMAHVSSGATGVLVGYTAGVTTFDISSITGAPIFNDGSGAFNPTGGLNNLWAANNALVLRLYENSSSGTPGVLVEEIVLTGSVVHGESGANITVLSISADAKTIRVSTAAPFVSHTGVQYDFTLTVDTWVGATTDALITSLGGTSPGVGGGSGSTTGWVSSDRLTFQERFDLRSAPVRGAVNAGSTVIEAGLEVWRVTASGLLCSVNQPHEVNADSLFTGAPLTLLERTGPSPDGSIPSGTPYTGTYDTTGVLVPGDGGELGTFKVMAWEGVPALPDAILPSTTGIHVAALPSSDSFEGGVICQGTAVVQDSLACMGVVSLGAGAVSNVAAGDVLVVSSSSVGDAAVSTGTYLIRHTVEDTSGSGYFPVALEGQAGPSGQWFNAVFPTVQAFALGSLQVAISDLGVGPSGSLWDLASGMNRLHVLPDAGDPTSIVSMQISSVDTLTNTFTLTTGTALQADGTTSLTDAAFFALLQEGQLVSGFRYVPIGPMGQGLPSNSVVGFGHGASTTFGFEDILLCNPVQTGNATIYKAHFSYGGPSAILVGPVVDGSETLGILESPVGDNRGFLAEGTTVYSGVPGWIDLGGIPVTGGTLVDWEAIHGGAAIHGIVLGGVRCLLPADRMVCSNAVNAQGNATGNQAFLADSGLWIEPSWARPTRPINDFNAHVVDASRSVNYAYQVGMRNPGDYLLPGSEVVSFTVRRIRRFHQPLQKAADNLTPLRFAYEIRVGVVSSYVDSGFLGKRLDADVSVFGFATQLGDFNDPNVNIHAGDQVRLLGVGGSVLDIAEVASVGTSYLMLVEPGFTQSVPVPGQSFSVFLRQAPVPHEQTNEELLGQVVNQVVHASIADPVLGKGGRVDVWNALKDPSVVDFTALGISQGDLVLVDPAGQLSGPTGTASPVEYGVRPFGDQSVAGRPSHVEGQPSPLDDNRGYYRVVSVEVDHLVVTGASTFTGPLDSDVVFGTSGLEYSVYPPVTGSSNANPSSLSGTSEGQQDLRPTRPAGVDSVDPNSYKGNQYSIEPFSYRVFKTSPVFSEGAVDLVLSMRERMLSWMEEIGLATMGLKAGAYFTFQRDLHIEALGDPGDPESGLGVVSNAMINQSAGLVGAAPFESASDCLSVLDRRFWVLDCRLDVETPVGGAIPYATLTLGEGRPVLPDRIQDVLDNEDRFRQLRYAWVRYRGDRVEGTLPSLERFVQDMPQRRQAQEDLLRMQEGLGLL